MRTIKTFLFVAFLTVGGLAVATPAHAQGCPGTPSSAAQQNAQLQSYANNHNTEEGEPFYLAWRAANCAPDFYTQSMHASGTLIAWDRGDIAAAVERDILAGNPLLLSSRYLTMFSPVQLRGFRAVPEAQRVLTGPGPNDPTFKRAATALRVTGRYGGFMRPGTYSIAGRTFTVAIGQSVDLTY